MPVHGTFARYNLGTRGRWPALAVFPRELGVSSPRTAPDRPDGLRPSLMLAMRMAHPAPWGQKPAGRWAAVCFLAREIFRPRNTAATRNAPSPG